MSRRFTFSALALLALGATVSGGRQDFPRLRTILPNGATVFVENMPKAKYVSVQLIAASYGVRETPKTHGWRHLLEHILVKGSDKGLRAKLESQGLFWTAETYRDATVIAITAPSESLDQALDGIGEYLKPLNTSPQEIEKELRIIQEEAALESRQRRISRELWLLAFGESALDSLGNGEVMNKATPESLERIRIRHFAPQNLVISISGPVAIEPVSRKCRELLSKDTSKFEPDTFKRVAQRAQVELTSEPAARAVATPGWNEPETAAILAAQLALAAERGDCFTIFTPSVHQGLAILGSESNKPGLLKWLADLRPTQVDALLPRGRLLVKEWLDRYLENPSGNAFLRGFLYGQARSAMPESMNDQIQAITIERFRAAVEKFRTGSSS